MNKEKLQTQMVETLQEVKEFVERNAKKQKENTEKAMRDVKKVYKVHTIKNLLKQVSSIDNLTLQYEAYLNAALELKKGQSKAKETLEVLRQDIQKILEPKEREYILQKYQKEIEEYNDNHGGSVGLRHLRRNLVELESIKTKQQKRDFKSFDKNVKGIEKEIKKISKKIQQKIQLTEEQLEEFTTFEKRMEEYGLVDAMLELQESYEIIPNDIKKIREEMIVKFEEISEKFSRTIMKYIWDVSIKEKSSRFAKMMTDAEQNFYRNVELVKQTKDKIILSTKDKEFLLVKNETDDKVDVLYVTIDEEGNSTLREFDETAPTIKLEQFICNFA